MEIREINIDDEEMRDKPFFKINELIDFCYMFIPETENYSVIRSRLIATKERMKLKHKKVIFKNNNEQEDSAGEQFIQDQLDRY